VFYVNRLEDTENLLNGNVFAKKKMKDDKFIPIFKERKKHDRFNGMPEEEVSKRTLPDHLALNLDIVIVSKTIFSLMFKIQHYNILISVLACIDGKLWMVPDFILRGRI
jgi:hypothetical protein